MMDRFYLNKLIDDTNHQVKQALTTWFGPNLTCFIALDSQIEDGDACLKTLRYLLSFKSNTPASRFLGIRETLLKVCRRMESSDCVCSLFIGDACWTPPAEDLYHFGLQFFILESRALQADSRRLVASLLDDPERQFQLLPAWFNLKEPVAWEAVEDQILAFTQMYLANSQGRLSDVRCLEAGFWRVVNVACHHFDVDCYEDLIALLPYRFREGLLEAPVIWGDLRRKGAGFSENDVARCGRVSLRFCQNLMTQGAQ